MNRGNWNGAAYSPLAEQLSPASTEALRSIGHVSTAYDVCAGTGNFTLPAAQSGIAVHALDLSASQLEVARERWIPRPELPNPLSRSAMHSLCRGRIRAPTPVSASSGSSSVPTLRSPSQR